MRTLLTSLTVAMIAAVSPARAADAPIYQAPLAAFSWQGWYAGLTAGYAWGDYTPFDEPTGGRAPEIDVDGFSGGATLGYNWHGASNWVYGIEADIQTGPDGTRSVGTVGPDWTCGTGRCNADIEWFATIRGRIGVARANWLLYGTAGVAFGDVEGGIFNSSQQGGGSAAGWTAGLGAEYAWSNKWSGKVEYLHVDLGDIPFGTDGGGGDFDGDGSFNVIRIGINRHFSTY